MSIRTIRALLISAVSLAVLASTVLAAKPGPGTSTGTGRVFFPNPVASLQDQSLTDQKDADYPALQPAYKVVALTNLDGSGYLHGDFAYVSGTKNDAYSDGLSGGIGERPQKRLGKVRSVSQTA